MFFHRPSRAELIAALEQAIKACRKADAVIVEQRQQISEQHEMLLAQNAMIETMGQALMDEGKVISENARPSCPHYRMSDAQASLLGLEIGADGAKVK
mgnify:CR=1 FL=1